MVFVQDPASASNGGSTTPSTATSGKKGKKSRGKEADTGNGDAGTVENSEPVAQKTRVVIFPVKPSSHRRHGQDSVSVV